MGAAKISDAETALLGLLSEEPMHPWQIEKTVKYRDMRFWTDLSQSTIYKQLRSLQQAGFVECRREACGGRLRKVFSMSKTGRAALAAKLRTLLSEPQHQKWRVDLATYNLDRLTKREALACLRAYRKKLEKSIQCYRELDAFLVSGECPSYRRAVARRPVHLLRGEIRWLDEFIREIVKGT